MHEHLCRGIRWRGRAAAICILAATASLQAQSVCKVSHLTADDAAPYQNFGWAVAVSGDTVLVGADYLGLLPGAAYVFRFDGTSWVQEQRLVGADGVAADHFGSAVAIDGDTAMVAAPNHIHAGFGGSVYVFRFDGTSWVWAQELLGVVGFSVSMSDDAALMGSPFDDDNATDAGAAYVFRYDPDSLQWVQEQKLLASDGAALDAFGWSVAISGDIAVAGALQHNAKCSGEPTSSAGASYVFRLDPQASCWVEQQKLTASDCGLIDNFGSSVSVSGDVVLVGADEPSGGAAYVFRYDPGAGAWYQEQELLASDGQGQDQFGDAVALGPDRALVGAWGNDEAGSAHGAAYLFRFDGSGWPQEQKLLPDPGPSTAFFGFSVAVDGDRAVVGAQGENTGAGAAYVLSGLSGIDCNGNGVADSCDIFTGSSEDADGDGVPDECCEADLDGDLVVGIVDLFALLTAWGTDPGGPPDLDGDGTVGITDLVLLLGQWGPCK